jgi:hypothetical protein
MSKSSSFPKKKSLLIALTVALTTSTLTALAVVSLVTLNQETKTPLSASSIMMLCSEDMNCESRYIVDNIDMVANDHYPTADQIFSGLTLASSVANLNKGGCHTLTHEIGRESFRRFGAAVLSVHTEDCNAGFTHGWMAELTETTSLAYSTKTITEYCAESAATSGCIHGIGHMLGQQTATPLAMHELCSAVSKNLTISNSTRSSLDACVSGWVMESAHPIRWSKFEGKNDIEKLCAGLGGEAQVTCNAMGMRRWFEQVPSDLARLDHFSSYCHNQTPAFAENLPLSYEAICITYLAEALRVSPNREVDPELAALRTTSLCTGKYQDLCVATTLNSISAETNGTAYARRFCAALDSAYRELCQGVKPIPRP